MALTGRERLLRVLRHQPTDRLPIVTTGFHPWHWTKDFPDYHPILEAAERHGEFMVSMGLDTGFLYGDPSVCERRVERRDLPGGVRETTTTVLTPKGPITGVRQRRPESGNWRVKAFVESEEDLDRLLSIPYEPVRPDVSPFLETRERIGEAGVAYFNGFHSPVTLLGTLMSEEFRAVFFYTQRERLREIVRDLARRAHDLLDHLLSAGVGPAFRWYAMEPFTEPMMPPEFVEEFIMPFDRELVGKVHAAGCCVVHHCHGRLGAMIGKMVRVGYDGVDCVESPPANDVTLAQMFALAEEAAAELRETTPDRERDDRPAFTAPPDRPLFLWGYIQMDDLEHRSAGEIERLVREAVEAGGADGRYVLGQAASPYMAHVPERMRENWIRMIETGARLAGGA